MFGLTLDGFPHALAVRLMEQGRMPNLKALARQGHFKELHGLCPAVSAVAWASFQAGVGPGKFGVYGAIELRTDLSTFVPEARQLKSPTILQRLSDRGKHVVSLGMPMTYPAPKVKGLLVSGFPARKLDERAVSGPEVAGKLRWTPYEIDIDPASAREGLDKFQSDLLRVAERRQKAALELMSSEPWDLFLVHATETYHLNRLMWHFRDQPDTPRGQFFLDFYSTIDGFVGEVLARLDKKSEFFILSDHGFCDLKWHVMLNRWLRAKGYLDYQPAADDPSNPYRVVREGSRALALDSGRIHLLTRFFWEKGGVADIDYKSLREEIVAGLRELKHPESGEAACKRVMTREEAFSGPHTDRAPDILIEPRDGYEPTGEMGEGGVFEPAQAGGMRTSNGALLLASKGLTELAGAANLTEAGAALARRLLG